MNSLIYHEHRLLLKMDIAALLTTSSGLTPG